MGSRCDGRLLTFRLGSVHGFSTRMAMSVIFGTSNNVGKGAFGTAEEEGSADQDDQADGEEQAGSSVVLHVVAQEGLAKALDHAGHAVSVLSTWGQSGLRCGGLDSHGFVRSLFFISLFSC